MTIEELLNKLSEICNDETKNRTVKIFPVICEKNQGYNITGISMDYSFNKKGELFLVSNEK